MPWPLENVFSIATKPIRQGAEGEVQLELRSKHHFRCEEGYAPSLTDKRTLLSARDALSLSVSVSLDGDAIEGEVLRSSGAIIAVRDFFRQHVVALSVRTAAVSPVFEDDLEVATVDLTLDTLSTTTIHSLPISKQSLHSIHLSLAFTSPSISSATTRQLFLSSSLPTPFSLPLLATLSTYATRNLAARYPLIFDGAHIQSLELDRQHHVTLARCLLYLAGPLLPPSPKRKRRRRVAAEDDSVLSVDDEEESQEEVERALMRVCLGGLQYRKVVFGGKVVDEQDRLSDVEAQSEGDVEILSYD